MVYQLLKTVHEISLGIRFGADDDDKWTKKIIMIHFFFCMRKIVFHI